MSDFCELKFFRKLRLWFKTMACSFYLRRQKSIMSIWWLLTFLGQPIPEDKEKIPVWHNLYTCINNIHFVGNQLHWLTGYLMRHTLHRPLQLAVVSCVDVVLVSAAHTWFIRICKQNVVNKSVQSKLFTHTSVCIHLFTLTAESTNFYYSKNKIKCVYIMK